MSTLSALQSQVVVPSNVQAEDTAEQDELNQQRVEFLNILITQLENQNPLDPMDTDEYTNQLIQYSQLDQQLEMKVGINDMKEILQGQNSIMALNYLGDTVELTTNAAAVQDGDAVWNYTVQGNVDDIKVQILNEDKEVVLEVEGEKTNGVHQLVFDAAASAIEDDTPLFLQIFAKDDQGELIEAVGITSYAKVDGLTGDGQDPYMTAGSLTFGIKDILKVSEDFVPASTTKVTATPSSSGTSGSGSSGS